jgi:hypothetical protein
MSHRTIIDQNSCWSELLLEGLEIQVPVQVGTIYIAFIVFKGNEQREF